MSALLALVPFWYIWRIIHDILEVSPDFSQAGNVTSYGWSAVLFAVLSIVVILSILVDTFISKISFPMQPGPEIGSISDA